MTVVDILKYLLELDDSQFTQKAKQAGQTTDDLTQSITGGLFNAIKGLGIAFAGIKLGDFIKDITLTSARTDVLDTVLTQVGDTAGKSRSSINELVEEVKSLGITTAGSRETVIRFIQSELDLAKASQLARVAQDAAVAARTNSTEALDRLLRGIQRGDTELLRSVGIFVNIERTLSKFAETNNKTRESLNDVERQTAILNAVLDQGKKLAGSYEAAMGDVGKRITSLPRLFEELANVLGRKTTPALSVAVDMLSKWLEVTRANFATPLENAAIATAKASQSFEKLKAQLPDLVARFNELRENTNRSASETTELYAVQNRIIAIAPNLIKAIDDEGIAYGLTTEEVNRYVLAKKESLNQASFAESVTIAERITAIKEQIRLLTEQYEKFGAATQLVQTLAGIPVPETLTGNEVLAKISALNEEMAVLEERLDRLSGRRVEPIEIVFPGGPNSFRFPVELFDALRKELGPVAQMLDEMREPVVFDFEINDSHFNEILRVRRELGRLVDIGPLVLFESIFSRIAALANEFNADVSDTINRLSLQFRAGVIDSSTFKSGLEEQLRIVEDTLGKESELYVQLNELIQNINADTNRQMKADIEKTLSGVDRIASSVFANISSEGAKAFNSILSSIRGFATGDIIGGIAGAFDSVVSIFGGSSGPRQSSADLIRSQTRLIDAIDQWRDTILSMSREDRAAQIAAINQALRILTAGGPNRPGPGPGGNARALLESVGISAEGLGVDQIIELCRQLLSELGNISVSSDKVLQATTQQLRAELVRQARSTDEAQFLIRTFQDLFKITPEEQLALLETALSTLGDKLSDLDVINLETAIRELRDQIAEGTAGSNDPTQVERSIARLTERQGDTLVSTLTTLDLHLQTGFDRVVEALGNLSISAFANLQAAAAGTTITIGEVVLTGSDAAKVESIVKSRLSADLRAAGETRRI